MTTSPKKRTTSIRQSPRPKRHPAAGFFVPFLIVVLLGAAVVASIPNRASAIPTEETASVPQVARNIITDIRDKIKAALRVAQDVAYKTGLRLFYAQVAQQAYLFASGAGSGNNPLFITSGDYWRNLGDAAVNDFIDNMNQEYFGKDVPRTDADSQRKLGLFLRGIFNESTVCEDGCQDAYNDLDGRAKVAQLELKSIRDQIKAFEDSGQLRPNTVACPVIFQDATQRRGAEFKISADTPLEDLDCEKALESAISTLRNKATREYSACTRACREGRAAEDKKIDPRFNELVGNDAVAAAVNDYFDVDQNQFGQTVDLIERVQEGETAAIVDEKVSRESEIGALRTVAGVVKAPVNVTGKATEKGLEDSTEAEQTYTGSKLADTIIKAAGKGLYERLLKFLASCDGLNPKACKTPTGTSAQARALFGSSDSSGRQAAELISARLGKIDLIAGDPSRSAISKTEEFVSEGIIDQRFGQAIDQKLRLQEAIDGGYIDGDKTFGFTAQKQEPIDGIPYRMILYLRQARIVPVGWELAAQFIRDFRPSNRSLAEIMDQYSICGQDAQHDIDPGVATCAGGGTKSGTSCTSDTECVEVVRPGDSCNRTPAEIAAGVAGSCASDALKSCYTDADCQEERGVCTDQWTASPFCGLVDPNWVLKAPLAYCRKSGAGEEVILKTFVCDQDTNGNARIDCGRGSGGGDIGHYEVQRQTDVCADEPTCIAENADGTCKSYGYCFEERPTYRFDGNECPAYYASCQSFIDQDGATVAYLKNTIDVNGCSADNANCQSYCRDRGDTSKSWLCLSDKEVAELAPGRGVPCPPGETCTCTLPNGVSCSVPTGADTCTVPGNPTCRLGTNSLFLDRDAKACDASDEGCREFLSVASTNVLPNGGFEKYTGTIDSAGTETIAGWTSAEIVSSDLEIGRNNLAAVRLRSGGSTLVFTNDRLPPLPVGFDLGRPLSLATVTMSFYGKASAACSGAFGMRSDDGRFTDTVTADYSTVWNRYQQRFEFSELNYANDYVQVFVNAPAGCDLDVDNMQLEVGSSAGDFQEYGTTGKVYLKSTRRSCDRADVGCERYTPKSGGDALTGVVNEADRCSEEHASCKQFRKEATDRIPVRPAVDPVNAVVSSARVCSASEVGCEEYTNLDVAARGGEAREYFSAIRQCVRPVDGNPTQKTYFSWIGDDRSGYQLKSYRLKVSNRDAGPCTNLRVGTIAEGNNPACEDSATNQRTCTFADLATNPDCTQFFDSVGTVFYRLQSFTVPVADDCTAYRNTIDERAGVDRVYLVMPSQSQRCSAEFAECRQFTGNTGNSARAVFSDTFEGSSTVTATWNEVGCSVAGTCVKLSSESVNASGRSMSLNGTTATNSSALSDQVRKGGSYTLSFWAKPDKICLGGTEAGKSCGADSQCGGGTCRVVNLAEASLQFRSGGTLTGTASLITSPKALAVDWHAYTVGPVTVQNDTAGQSVELRLRTADGGGSPVIVYIDNVVLREVTDAAYLVDNSFRTCPDSELGCEAYADRRGQTTYLKSFTRLCAIQSVGCSALIDTQNSSDPFRGLPIRGVATPPDETRSFVVEPDVLCSSTAKGCSAFGLPSLDVQKHVSSYQTVYLKDEPDRYATILCSADEVDCREFTAANGGPTYFRDPGAQTCEYKRLGGRSEFAWYMTGTQIRCPISPKYQTETPTGRACVRSCNGGIRSGLACSVDTDCPGLCQDQGGVKRCVGGSRPGDLCTQDGDCPALCAGNVATVGRSCTPSTAAADCGGNICDLWTGICPEEQSGCNEYRDPTDPPLCRSECAYQTSASGGEVPLDDQCLPTICQGGSQPGAYCVNNLDCPGACVGGSTDGETCFSNADCESSVCSTGICSGEGIPGCRSYYYLRQTVEPSAVACNGRIDPDVGCRAFNDTSNPTLNFRAQ